MTNADHPGPGSSPASSTPQDPSAADQTPCLLDPRFISGLVNELYAESGPATPEGILNQSVPSLPSAGKPSVPSMPHGPVDWERAVHQLRERDNKREPGRVPTAAVPEAIPSMGGGDFYFLPHTPPVPTPDRQSSRPFHVEAIRRDFPILQQYVHGKPLIWLDNAATTQKPRQMIDALVRFYERDNSNIHRAAHTLAARATTAYEEAREKVRKFLGASQVEEIIFVRGATEAINLAAQIFGRKFLTRDDEIVLTTIEHHANIVPWQMVARERGAILRVVPVNDRGEVILEEYERLLGPRTRVVALAHVSNAIGTVLPVRTMTELAHRHGARVLIDGAQSVAHMPIDVQELDCDFFAFSGHKVFGPTGIGVLYGKKALLDAMPPWQGGGNMIDQVTFEQTTYQQPPMRFEAGTGNLAGAVGLGAAIDYIASIGLENINRYEHELLAHGTEVLRSVPGLRLIGTAADKASVLSFVLDGMRPEDVGRYLDQEGIAVRAGHHCAQPTMRRFAVASTVRPSLAFYNTSAEIDALGAALRRIRHRV